MKTITTADLDAYRATLRHYRDLERVLHEAYDVTHTDPERSTPMHTVCEAADRVGGLQDIVTIVATLVNQTAWDGRIDPRNAKWAAAQEDALSEEDSRRLSVFNHLHPAHLDQVADVLRYHLDRFEKVDGHWVYHF